MDLNPLNQLNIFIIAATVVVFVATYLMLRRFFADKVVRVMEQRRVRCEVAEKLCQEAQASIAEAEQAAAELGTTTGEEAEGIVQVAREKAQVEKGQALTEARKRTEELLREGRAEIEREKQAEIARVRTEAIECVGLACEKIVGEVEGDVVTATVDRALARTIQ
jgi:F-type H+-transporting ATPase subunit b